MATQTNKQTNKQTNNKKKNAYVSVNFVISEI